MTVRTGTSSRSRPIKSNDDICFRFECGEYLRASEILTIHGHADLDQSDDISGEVIVHPSESFAKLYRVKKRDNTTQEVSSFGVNSNSRMKQNVIPLSSYTSSCEWVHVHCNGNLYLEECVNPPTIKRDRDGWDYEIMYESGVPIRKGPSFSAHLTGSKLQCSAIVSINEVVTADGESISWLRLKDGRGFICTHGENGDTMVIKKRNQVKKSVNDQSYKLIARLFQPSDLSSK